MLRVISISINENLNMFATSSIDDGNNNLYFLSSFNMVHSIILYKKEKYEIKDYEYEESKKNVLLLIYISLKIIFNTYPINREFKIKLKKK